MKYRLEFMRDDGIRVSAMAPEVYLFPQVYNLAIRTSEYFNTSVSIIDDEENEEIVAVAYSEKVGIYDDIEDIRQEPRQVSCPPELEGMRPVPGYEER